MNDSKEKKCTAQNLPLLVLQNVYGIHGNLGLLSIFSWMNSGRRTWQVWGASPSQKPMKSDFFVFVSKFVSNTDSVPLVPSGGSGEHRRIINKSMNITELLSEVELFYCNFMFTYKTISLYPVLENIDWMNRFYETCTYYCTKICHTHSLISSFSYKDKVSFLSFELLNPNS